MIATITTIAWSAAGIAAAVFMAAYHLAAPWRASAIGRHMMAFAGAILATVSTVWMRLLWGAQPWMAALRMACAIAIAALLVQRVWLLLRAQWHARGCARSSDDSDGSPLP